MTTRPLPPCRLHMIMAREAPRAVILRRGPTDWTQLILWHTDTDEFEYGQWFRGHIYFRRSDLSPDGTKLIYFARKINGKTKRDKEYTYAWTAISKPPYYTALALWPKGDCWHGGGLFEDNNTVFLNHKPERAIPHPDHMPQGLAVRPNPDARGEDDPVYTQHLLRDGWVIWQEWEGTLTKSPIYYKTIAPQILARLHLSGEYSVQLSRRLDRLTYRELFSVVDRERKVVLDLPHIDRADWDQRGRLAVLRDGKLSIAEVPELHLRELVDFNSQTHQPVAPPSWATQW